MTLYGIGLGPGDAGLVTVRGRELLEDADVVYAPGRLSRSVATEFVPDARISDLDFPMTSDPDELRAAWRAAATEVAPEARGEDATAAFVTLGDPNVYSTFGHLRRTLDHFHPEVGVEVVPGVSAVTAFTTTLGVEVEAGAGLALREAAGGASPTGPDRMVLFKVTDAPATHEGLVEAGYEVRYGRRLYMEQGETLVTEDPAEVADRDYYTLAYAERADVDVSQPTAAFEEQPVEEQTVEKSPVESEDGVRTDGGRSSPSGHLPAGRQAPPLGGDGAAIDGSNVARDDHGATPTGDVPFGANTIPTDTDRVAAVERTVGCANGDCEHEVGSDE